MRTVTVTLALLTALLAGCSNPSTPEPSATPPTPGATLPAEFAPGSQWLLVDPALPGEATVTFDAGRLSGSAQVNSYSAMVTAGTDGSLDIGPIARTEMAGEPELMQAEDRYFALLDRVDGWQGDGTQLFLTAGDETLLRYALPDSPAAFGATLVGLPVAEARAAARDEGYAFRVISVDGESKPVTMDYNPQRLNAAVVDGRVTEVTVG
jgi:heat shock protein HslJ